MFLYLGLFLTIPYILASLVTPFIGTFVDKFKNRPLLIIVTSCIFLITHVFLLTIDCDKACGAVSVPLISLGICYALYSAVLIPSIPLVVKP